MQKWYISHGILKYRLCNFDEKGGANPKESQRRAAH